MAPEGPQQAPAEAGPSQLPPAPTWEEVQAALLSCAAPVTERYRALFHARTAAPSPAAAAKLLVRAMPEQRDSVLLRHEAAYVLGQLGEPAAAGHLEAVALDEAEDDIVRHEAVEALAALGDAGVAELLGRLAEQTSSEALRHTCELALAGLQRAEAAGAEPGRPACVCQYTSRDPAEGWPQATERDVPAAAEALDDARRPLYERYEGLFTLRNVGGPAAAEALAAMLRRDRSSAVLRHEVAFVLGQMEEQSAVEALATSLACREEHAMVRHEAAIALGTVGTAAAEAALRAHEADPDALVSQSCEVALATAAYWRAWEELEARVAAGG